MVSRSVSRCAGFVRQASTQYGRESGSASSTLPLKITMRGAHPRHATLSRGARSRPEMSGSSTSSKTTSGSNSNALRSAVAPSPAVLTDTAGSIVKHSAVSSAVVESSSTIRTRIAQPLPFHASSKGMSIHGAPYQRLRAFYFATDPPCGQLSAAPHCTYTGVLARGTHV